MTIDSPATRWPWTHWDTAIDPQLPPASQYALLDALNRRENHGRRGRQARQLLATLRDRYVEPLAELDDEAHGTFWRAAEAINDAETAAFSDAVDGIEARIVLSAQRWEIAHELAAQTRLRQAKAACGIAQDRALAAAVAGTNRRVDSVIAYVRQLTDRAQTARRSEQGPALAEQRLDVLAATEADTLAVSQLGEMTARAGNPQQTLTDPASDRDARPLMRGLRQLTQALSFTWQPAGHSPPGRR